MVGELSPGDSSDELRVDEPATLKTELREGPEGPRRVTRKVSAGESGPPPSEFVPGRLIVKFKTLEDPAQIAEAKARLEVLSAQFGVTETTPLFKPFILVWERQRKASGPTTRKRTGWYWYLEEKDWMPEEKEESATGPEGQSPERILQDQKASRIALEELHLQDIQLLTLPEETDLDAAARAFSQDPAVEFAHPDPIVKLFALPNDTYVDGDQDGQWDTGAWGQPFANLYGLKNTQAVPGWDRSEGEAVVVAVSDTGIDYNHPDLAANVWTNPGETGQDASGRDKRSNGVDDDANGFVDDWRGYDFVTMDGTPADNDPMDDHGHGTHVAGTIAALSNNGLGIAGVAPKAKVMAVKGLSGFGSGSTADLASGIAYAANNGAQVINASWGGFGQTPWALLFALAYAHDAKDVVFVAAAGNSNWDVRTPEYGFFPANLRDAVTVSAYDSTDAMSFFSNFGVKIDVGAPGGGDSQPTTIYEPHRSILSLKSSQAWSDMTGSGQLVIGSDYLRQAGTSMAAPHVSGAGR